jgi:hypothetical protein
MKVRVQTAEYMISRCSERYPAMKREFESQVVLWRDADSAAIAKAEGLWTELVKQEPKTEQALNGAVLRAEFALALFTLLPPEAAETSFARFCGTHFSDLSSGVWRVRTPMLYWYLEGSN